MTVRLWNSLLERRGYQITDGEVILSPSKMKADPAEMNICPSPPRRPEVPHRESVISSFRRANSFAPVVREEAGSSRPIPFKRAATSAAVFTDHNAQAGPSKRVISPPCPRSSSNCAVPGKPSVPTRNIFDGMIFRVLGEAKKPTVRQAIEEQGGRMSAEEEDATFIIVRLVRSVPD